MGVVNPAWFAQVFCFWCFLRGVVNCLIFIDVGYSETGFDR
jgi:hypothetical protein